MNTDIQRAYLDNGFFWNENLSAFATEFADKELTYPHHKTGKLMKARFFPTGIMSVNREKAKYELTSQFLKEEVAPVGHCNDDHIDLLLTCSGKLIGFADYLLLRWGHESEDWRSSLAKLLAGDAPLNLAILE